MRRHKHDPGTYSVKLFTQAGRPRQKLWVANCYQASIELVQRWGRRTGGTGVITRCLYNSGLTRPTMPGDSQR
jgi:hypothetical protein